MKQIHSENTRIKRKYLVWLADARGLSEGSVDKAAASVDKYVDWLKGRAFKAFNAEYARGFKRYLEAARNPRTGRALSASTIDQTLRDLMAFHRWLADQPGFKSRLRHGDADYFTPSRRIAKSARGVCWRPHPTPEQIHHVLRMMPSESVLQRRDRAIIAFLFLTGCRDGAAATLRLGNIDSVEGCVHFTGPDVETKFGKVFTSWFLPVGGVVRRYLDDWMSELRSDHLYGSDDPLFPRTKVGIGHNKRFAAIGLSRERWKSGATINKLFQAAFAEAGLPVFHAHTIRHTLSELGSRICTTPEEMKAWSQNVGHEDIMTTFRSYGTVALGRQAEILRNLKIDHSLLEDR